MCLRILLCFHFRIYYLIFCRRFSRRIDSDFFYHHNHYCKSARIEWCGSSWNRGKNHELFVFDTFVHVVHRLCTWCPEYRGKETEACGADVKIRHYSYGKYWIGGFHTDAIWSRKCGGTVPIHLISYGIGNGCRLSAVCRYLYCYVCNITAQKKKIPWHISVKGV